MSGAENPQFARASLGVFFQDELVSRRGGGVGREELGWVGSVGGSCTQGLGLEGDTIGPRLFV